MTKKLPLSKPARQTLSLDSRGPNLSPLTLKKEVESKNSESNPVVQPSIVNDHSSDQKFSKILLYAGAILLVSLCFGLTYWISMSETGQNPEHSKNQKANDSNKLPKLMEEIENSRIEINSLRSRLEQQSLESKVPAKNWYRPAAIPEGFKLDRDTCTAANADENRFSACMVQRGWTLIDPAKITSDRRECREKFPPVSGDARALGNYHDCIRRRGWDDEFESAKRARINQQGIQDFCSLEKYAHIVKRVPCSVPKILLEHLADSGRVSESERGAWLDFFNKLDPQIAEYREILRTGPMGFRKTYELNMKFAREIDDRKLALVMGEITFGEYNRSRKDMKAEYDEGMLKINEEVRAFIDSPAPLR